MAAARRAAVLIGVAAALAASGCGRRSPSRGGAAGGTAVLDEVGRKVVARSSPTRRVVSLAPNITELLFAIGAADQLVGVDGYSDEPTGRVASIAKVGSDYDPSLETIVGLSPDLVFTSLSANRRETADALERLGIPVFVTSTYSLPDLYRTLDNLGAVTGHAPEAKQEAARLRAAFAAVGKRVPAGPKPKVLVVVWDDPLYVAGRATFTQDLIELCGGTNVAADVTGFAKYPLERVLHAQPEIIIVPTHSVAEQGPRAVAYWSRWSELPAVRRRRVHPIEDAILSRPGPRLSRGAELLFALMYPDTRTAIGNATGNATGNASP